MTFIVYIHTNKKNYKRYVGFCELYKKCLTPYDAMMKRWSRGHLSGVRNRSTCYFHNAIRKWGSGDDVWDHEVLDVLRTSKAAKHAEILWIFQRKTFAYDKGNLGYNETRGGEGSLGRQVSIESKLKMSRSKLGKKLNISPEVQARLSALRKQRKLTPEHQQKLIEANHRKLGTHPSEKTRKKMSEKAKGRIVSVEARKKRSDNAYIRWNRNVQQLLIPTLDVIAEFRSNAEASRITNINRLAISKCARGISSDAGGFNWRYISLGDVSSNKESLLCAQSLLTDPAS
jgi:hypothetical protein